MPALHITLTINTRAIILEANTNATSNTIAKPSTAKINIDIAGGSRASNNTTNNNNNNNNSSNNTTIPV